MSYSVNPSVFRTIFPVPAEIVDKHIRLASGDQLKVLLWILRNSPENPNIDEMCKALKMNKSDAEDYLQYWVLTGVLSSGDEQPNFRQERQPSQPPEAEKKVQFSSTSQAAQNSEENTTKIKKVVPIEPITPSKPSSAEIAARIEESPEIGHLFNEAQIKLGKTIGYDGQCVLLLLHDHYGLPIEVIFMMIDYCVWAGKTNYGYIEAIGKDWGTKEIDTLEKAAEKIAALKSSARLWNEFAAATGIKTPRPTMKQSELLTRWSTEFGYGIDMIMIAYEEMAEHTGKLSFAYMDKVLSNWHTKDCKTPEDIEALKAAPKSSAQTSNGLNGVKGAKGASSVQASYDLDEFNSRSLLKPLKYERKKK